MDRHVASGLAMFIIGGWTLSIFAFYGLASPNRIEPPANIQNPVSAYAIKLTLPVIQYSRKVNIGSICTQINPEATCEAEEP